MNLWILVLFGRVGAGADWRWAHHGLRVLARPSRKPARLSYPCYGLQVTKLAHLIYCTTTGLWRRMHALERPPDALERPPGLTGTSSSRKCMRLSAHISVFQLISMGPFVNPLCGKHGLAVRGVACQPLSRQASRETCLLPTCLEI